MAEPSRGGAASHVASGAPVPEGAKAFPAPGTIQARGRRVFLQKCASCHLGDGQGSPGDCPPLAGSEVVLGRANFGEDALARVVLNGLVGPVVVRGSKYNGVMPPWKDDLDDEECFVLLTYLRQAWSNQGPPISASRIPELRLEAERRAAPWTVGELKAVPAVSASFPRPANP